MNSAKFKHNYNTVHNYIYEQYYNIIMLKYSTVH